MAKTRAGAQLTEEHRQEQIRIRAAFLAEFIRAWPILDITRIDETSAAWLRAAMEAVRSSRLQSVNAAESYFDRYRQVEVPNVSSPAPRLQIVHAPDVTGHRDPDPAPDIAPVIESRRQSGNTRRRRDDDPAHFGEFKPAVLDFGNKDEFVARSLHTAGPNYAKYLTKRGEDPDRAKLKVVVNVSGTAGRQVLNGGRDALEELVQADPVALGWARVTDGDPCAFCAMLASRGPVYKSRETAAFLPHDHCACIPEPVYSRSAAWAPGARELRQLWLASTKGYSGKDAVNAFRRAYERGLRERATTPAALHA